MGLLAYVLSAISYRAAMRLREASAGPRNIDERLKNGIKRRKNTRRRLKTLRFPRVNDDAALHSTMPAMPTTMSPVAPTLRAIAAGAVSSPRNPLQTRAKAVL